MKAWPSIFIFCAFASTAVAGGLEDATSAYQRGDFNVAIRLFQSLADEGSSDAQYQLGVMYHKGQGTRRENAVALKWLLAAADQYQGAAMKYLGMMYETGERVKQDFAESLKWYYLASKYHSMTDVQEWAREFAQIQSAHDRVTAKASVEQREAGLKLAQQWKPGETH